MVEKLDNPFTAPKAYWSILNNFLGKRKTPNISLLIVNDFVVSDFTTKANLFNNFFASKCSPVVNSSTLPNFYHKTQKRINDTDIRMIQVCGKSIVKPLNYLSESSLTDGIFPEDWKKANTIPVHK